MKGIGITVSGDHNSNVGNHHETNYHGMSKEELIELLKERFQYTLEKEEQIKQIFDENRKLTDEVIRQNADFRMYNAAYQRQLEKIDKLNNEIIALREHLLRNEKR